MAGNGNAGTAIGMVVEVRRTELVQRNYVRFLRTAGVKRVRASGQLSRKVKDKSERRRLRCRMSALADPPNSVLRSS